jgi:hypothetical protein
MLIEFRVPAIKGIWAFSHTHEEKLHRPNETGKLFLKIFFDKNKNAILLLVFPHQLPFVKNPQTYRGTLSKRQCIAEERV